MKTLLIFLVIVAPTLALSAEQWRIFKNDKYKYEIHYPGSCKVIITGPEKERDGRTVRIGMENTARMHGIDIEIHPGMSLERLMSQIKAPELSKLERGPVATITKLHKFTWQKTRINGVAAVKMQARFTENGELFMTSVVIDRVVFTAHLWRDGGLDEKAAEQIISTFKWWNGSHNKPDAGDGK